MNLITQNEPARASKKSIRMHSASVAIFLQTHWAQIKEYLLRVVFFASSSLLLTACIVTTDSSGMTTAAPLIAASATEETVRAREILTGNWYGTQKLDDGSRQEWLMKRAVDGTYEISYRITSTDGSVDEGGEVGIWGIRLPVYFTATRGFVGSDGVMPANVTDPAFYDAYEVKELTQETFTYYSYASGNTFTVKKVPSDFRFDI